MPFLTTNPKGKACGSVLTCRPCNHDPPLSNMNHEADTWKGTARSMASWQWSMQCISWISLLENDQMVQRGQPKEHLSFALPVLELVQTWFQTLHWMCLPSNFTSLRRILGSFLPTSMSKVNEPAQQVGFADKAELHSSVLPQLNSLGGLVEQGWCCKQHQGSSALSGCGCLWMVVEIELENEI